MEGVLETGRSIYDRLIHNSPWLRSAAIVGGLVAGLAFLNLQLPSDIAIDLSAGSLREISIAVIVITYFTFVAVLSGDLLREERRLRSLERAFRYDKRGTLYNGAEPNISFRVETFKGILAGISQSLDRDKAISAHVAAGREAAKDFATNIPDIYSREIRSKSGGAPWSELSLSKKVFEWTEYDSATGWGIMAGRLKENRVTISITHLRGLFEDEGGELFAHFLAGYCETVLSKMVEEHLSGRYTEYDRVELRHTNFKGGGLIELAYDLF